MYRNVFIQGEIVLSTIKDVAKLAGVAVSTVSYALNGSTKVSEATREKILTAAKNLNYKKNSFASALKKQSTKTIVLILSDLSGPYYSELIKGVQDTALKYGYDLIACSSVGGRESTGIKFLKEHRVDGAIVLSAYIPGNMLLETAREGFPIVVLDRIIHNSHLINVTVNNKQGGYKATEHLISLGHEKIGFMGGPINTIDSRDRFSGYLEALNDNQLPFEDKWLMPGNFTRESGYEGTKTLLESGIELPTAMFYANDEMAIGGIKAFQEAD